MSDQSNPSDTTKREPSTTPDPSASARSTSTDTTRKTDSKPIDRAHIAEAAVISNLAAQNIALNPDLDFYSFTDPRFDRERQIAQSLVFNEYLHAYTYRFIGRTMMRILDVGCGEGLAAVTLKRLYPDAHVIGIDLDSRAIDTARQRQEILPGVGDPVEYMLGNAEAELPGGQYDLVYISMVLLHSADPKQILQNAKKVIKPGGYIWVKDVYPDFLTAITHPHWLKLGTLTEAALNEQGHEAGIAPELPQMLVDLDFAEIRIEDEKYAMSNENVTSRIMLAYALAFMRNALSSVAANQRIDESDLIAIYAALTQDAPMLHGPLHFANLIARRTGNFIIS